MEITNGISLVRNFESHFINWYIMPIGLYLAYRFIKFLKNDFKHGKEMGLKVHINRDKYAKEVNKEIYYFNEYRAIAFDNETKKFEYLNSKELSGTNN